MAVAIGKDRRSGAQLGRSWKETSARGFQERPVAFLAERSGQGYFALDIQPGVAQQVGDVIVFQPRSIKLHPDRLFLLVETDLPDPVDLARIR